MTKRRRPRPTSRKPPTEVECWHAAVLAREMVNGWIDGALQEGIEPEALSMWFIDAACNLQCMCDHDDEARRVLIKQVGEFFRDGPLPGGAERLFTDGPLVE